MRKKSYGVYRARKLIGFLCLQTMVSFLLGNAWLPAAEEPNVEIAKRWWPPQRNEWVPIGWKNHYFRFNVVYNGTVLCEPCPDWTPPRPHAKKWQGQNFQLTFWPEKNGKPLPLPKEPTQLWRLDTGLGNQGWHQDYETPVFWTEWRLQEGLVMRQEIFAHMKGSGDVQSGIEPIYAWIRLSVTHVDEVHAVEKFPMSVQLSKIYYWQNGRYQNEDSVTIDVDSKFAPYPKSLRSEDFEENGKTGLRILEPDGKVRMVVLPTSQGKVTFFETETNSHIYALKLDMEGKLGDHVDLLVPMLPEVREEMDAEQAFGYEGALAQCEPYWKKKPASAAHVHVPEDYINRVIKQTLKYSEIVAEKDYVNGEYSYLTGSWGYDNLWSTPTSMTTFMFLDLLGYHESVARHVELFRKNQGSVKPPGPAYDLHPGYFSTPKTLTAFDWLTDHGAILHQVSTHALLTDDKEFIGRWADAIILACEFIKDSCAKTNHDGVIGLLPPAVATDEVLPNQAVWNLAWHYKGLNSAVHLLKKINHPRAIEFETFARQFKNTFVKAYRQRSETAPQWTDASGKKRVKPPMTLSTKPKPFHLFSEAFYLDTGPLVLVWSGLLNADDELMRSCMQYFREGPNTKLIGHRHHAMARPILIHEISSCEPCYSWNIFHSWQLGDRQNFLEGLYSLYLGGISPQTYISCEYRHGVHGQQTVGHLAFDLSRRAVLDDEIKPGEIHLLRLCPLAWISTKEETIFEKMPTEYGPVNLRFKLSEDKKTLDVKFSGNWREKPDKVVLHIPPVKGLKTINLNGKNLSAKKAIELKKF